MTASNPKRPPVKELVSKQYRPMRTVTYRRYEPHPGWSKRISAPLSTFIYDVPHLLCWGILPPFRSLNDFLHRGGGDGGMSPSADWQPFHLSEDEYSELCASLETIDPVDLWLQRVYAWNKAKRAPEFDNIKEPLKWGQAVTKKYRSDAMAEADRNMARVEALQAEVLSTAEAMARSAHEGQMRKNGQPYISHIESVVAQMHPEDFDGQVVAWLHDIVEDTETSLEDLASATIPEYLIDEIESLSKRREETYLDYISRVKESDLATAVKKADIASNLMDNPGNKQITKFAHALIKLAK